MLRNWRLDKKNVNPAAELERSIDSVLSQYAEMKKKFDAMAQELKSAKDDFTSAQEQQAEVADLYAQLSEMSDKCNEKDEKVETVNARICCSICEDRDKNVSFACGHTYCRECATKCGTCPMRCASERTGKPVKYFFPVFL
ncbi:E3 ubiquitin-protein ligase MIB2 [Aphelenchoides avenae]|nr:E3 ubiquitin-protein ligase MIB2 [Aphelenchus avenae]